MEIYLSLPSDLQRFVIDDKLLATDSELVRQSREKIMLDATNQDAYSKNTISIPTEKDGSCLLGTLDNKRCYTDLTIGGLEDLTVIGDHIQDMVEEWVLAESHLDVKREFNSSVFYLSEAHKWCDYGERRTSDDYINMCSAIDDVSMTILNHTSIRTHSPKFVNYLAQSEHSPIHHKYLNDRLLSSSITYELSDFKSLLSLDEDSFNDKTLSILDNLQLIRKCLDPHKYERTIGLPPIARSRGSLTVFEPLVTDHQLGLYDVNKQSTVHINSNDKVVETRYINLEVLSHILNLQHNSEIDTNLRNSIRQESDTLRRSCYNLDRHSDLFQYQHNSDAYLLREVCPLIVSTQQALTDTTTVKKRKLT
jgi:hypothetical protein